MDHIRNLMGQAGNPPSGSQSESTSKQSAPTGGITSRGGKFLPQPENACRKCGGTGFFRRDVPLSDPNFGKLIKCTDPSHSAMRVSTLSSLTQMHPDDVKIRLSDIGEVDGNAEMLKGCRKMLKTPRGWLYIWGGPGNAKSIALRAMCNHLALQGFYPVVYIKFSRLVEIMRRAASSQVAKGRHFEKHGSLELWDNGTIDTFDRLLMIPVLAIEEFDKARMTEFAQEFRFDFLDSRYEQGIRGETITMFASQDPPEALPAPLASRINSGKFIVVENVAGDARQSESWE